MWPSMSPRFQAAACASMTERTAATFLSSAGDFGTRFWYPRTTTAATATSDATVKTFLLLICFNAPCFDCQAREHTRIRAVTSRVNLSLRPEELLQIPGPRSEPSANVGAHGGDELVRGVVCARLNIRGALAKSLGVIGDARRRVELVALAREVKN